MSWWSSRATKRWIARQITGITSHSQPNGNQSILQNQDGNEREAISVNTFGILWLVYLIKVARWLERIPQHHRHFDKMLDFNKHSNGQWTKRALTHWTWGIFLFMFVYNCALYHITSGSIVQPKQNLLITPRRKRKLKHPTTTQQPP